MDKSREARSSLATVSSRRRNRATVSRDLPEEEEGKVELQETVRLRERGSNRNRNRSRDRNFTRKRRSEEEEEDISVDSDGVEDSSGVSALNQNQRKNSLLPPRVVKQQWKVVVDDSMIGVPVPRKARSASVKRSHDCGEEEIGDDSPSTSAVSMKKKMKLTGLKSRTTTKTFKDSCVSAKEGDIEIEIAEVLFGLMKQTQSPKNEQVTESENSVDEKNKVIHESSSFLAKSKSEKTEMEIRPSDLNMNLNELDESKATDGDSNSIPTKSIPETKIQKEDILKFDLMMAPPASPEMVLGAKPLNLEVEMEKEISNKVENEGEFKEKEKMMDEIEHKVTSGKKLEFFKLDLEKTHLDGSKKQEQSQKQQSKGSGETIEKNESSTLVRLPVSLGAWPTFQTVDKASTNLQHPNFILSYPRPKRCLTHYDIARNIYLHQQFTKTNYLQPAADSSASLVEAKLKNMSSSESMILCNPLNGNHLDVNILSVQQREQAAADLPSNVVNDKSPETTNFFGVAKSKQLVFQQEQGASLGNSVPGPGFIFPINQHQAPITTTAKQSGSTKSSNSATSLFNNPNAGTLESFPALPAVSSSMSFSHPNLVSIEAPYSTKLQNNSYPFLFSTPAGTTTTYRANHAQALPLFNGSFYSSQLYHPSQVQPPQAQSHNVVQSIQQSGGSLTHKHPQTQQQKWSVHVPGNNSLPLNSMQVKRSMEQHLPLPNQPRKNESETSGEDATSLSDKRTPQLQKNVYGQNFILPVQALNFTLMPSATMNSGNTGNHGEKKQSHSQNLKSTVALVPSQALTMSFASFGGTSSNLSFAPMPQNTTVFQSLPDVQRAGFQVAPAPQATKQKNHQISEGRNGGVVSNTSDRNTGNSGKASATSGQTLIFGNSARTLNFTSSPIPGSWPSPSIKSTGLTTNRPPAGSPPSSQQQQQMLQLQLQQPHIFQQQPQATMTPRTKVPTSNSSPASSVPTKFPHNAPSFSQSLIQRDNSIQSPPPKNSGRMAASIVPMTSLPAASATAVHKNFTQQKGNTPQGQTQISFGIPASNHSPSSSGKLRNNSTSSKTGSSNVTLQSKQQDESSSTGPGQKSSPVCGRNVPSILNTCPTHLSELKY